MQQLAVRQSLDEYYLQGERGERTLDHLRARMYHQMDESITSLLKDGQPRVVQYGEVEKLPRHYNGNYGYRTVVEYELRAYTWPVKVTPFQPEYRMLAMREPEWSKPPTPQDAAVGTWVHSQDLDKLAESRTYVFLGKRAFERNASGWRRVW